MYVAISDGHYDAHGNQGAAADATFTVAAPPTPDAVTDLSATRGVRKLDLSWTAPTGMVTGYDVHYTSSATVKDDSPEADASGSDPSAAWVDAGHTGDGTTVSDEITGLTPLTFYYFRVRAVNDAGNDPWEVVLGFPLPEPHGGAAHPRLRPAGQADVQRRGAGPADDNDGGFLRLKLRSGPAAARPAARNAKADAVTAAADSHQCSR